MMTFLDLPLELLPLILSYILKPHHLAVVCLVGKNFCKFTAPNLYHRIAIFAWQREAKIRVIQLFKTLSRCRHLARLVHRLELRDFPKVFTSNAGFTLETVLAGLNNCTNLRACTWTRDGSLNTDILLALQAPSSATLQELEINGRSESNYDPTILKGFTSLTKITLIMPSGPVVQQLRGWVEVTGGTLKDLTIICKASSIVTDDVLETLSPYLCNLKRFYITGCPRVTERGAWAILSRNKAGISGLGLEAISPRFDMHEFTQRTLRFRTLTSLTSVTLTIPPSFSLQSYLEDVSSLLSSSPLQNFHIYATTLIREYLSSSSSSPTRGAPLFSDIIDDFWSRLVESHKETLIRVSVHRMPMPMRAIEEICKKCVRLEQFFIVVEPNSLETLASCLSHARFLRALHINFYPISPNTDTTDSDSPPPPPVISATDALAIIRRCTPSLTQFGCNARVWQVSRVIEVDPESDEGLKSYPKLAPYESPDIPEQFLVVRT